MKTCSSLGLLLLATACTAIDIEPTLEKEYKTNLVSCTIKAEIPGSTKVAIEGDAASQPITVSWKASSSDFRDSFALVYDDDGFLIKNIAYRLASEVDDSPNGTFEATVPDGELLYALYPAKNYDSIFNSGRDYDKNNWVYSMEGQSGKFEDVPDYLFMTGDSSVKAVDGELDLNMHFNYEVAILRLSGLKIPDLAGKDISGITLKSNAIASKASWRYSFNSYSGADTQIITSGTFHVGDDGTISDNVYIVFFPSNQTISTCAIVLSYNDKVYSYIYDGSLSSFTKGKVYTLKNKTLQSISSPAYDWYLHPIAAGQYEISTAEDLKGFANLVNGDPVALATVSEDSAIDFSGSFVRIADGISEIDLSTVCGVTANWEPINGFAGTFDGNGATVSHLYFNGAIPMISKTAIGLFGNVKCATIMNLSVTGIINTSAGYDCNIGGIVGYMSGNYKDDAPHPAVLKNCNSNVSINHFPSSSSAYVGGVVGRAGNYADILGCSSTSSIQMSISDEYTLYCVGGIAGITDGGWVNIVGCSHSTGELKAWNNNAFYPAVGGIIGFNNGSGSFKIISCYNSSNVVAYKPGMILGSYGIGAGTPNISSSYYTGTERGIGLIQYANGGNTYDAGTTKVTDTSIAITSMNTGIHEWNTANPSYQCSRFYSLINGEITLL